MKHKIMIHISTQTSGRLIACLAKFLHQFNNEIVITGDNEADLSDLSSRLPDNMITTQLADVNPGMISEKNNSQKDGYPFDQKFKDFNLSSSELATLSAHYNLLNEKFEIAKNIIKYYQPNILIVSEDGISGNCFIIHAARAQNIPILVVPYGYGTSRDLDNSLEIKSRNNELTKCEGNLGEIVKTHYPQWIKQNRFAGALMYIPAYIIAREALGLSIPKPWIIHGGVSDKIAVESQQMFKHYLDEGISEEKLVLTGTIYCDLLYNEIREPKFNLAYINSDKIDASSTSLLICWPPSYHAERAHLCEFNSYEELITHFFNFIKHLNNVKVTVSLHPAILPEHRKMIEKYVDDISEEYIINLIPKHDIYLSCFSSTIRWAVASGKPVINYDFYGFNLIDFDRAPGVLKIKTFEEFKEATHLLVADNHYYKDVTSLQKSVASEWGMIDGKNFERIYDLINDLMGIQTITEEDAFLVPV